MNPGNPINDFLEKLPAAGLHIGKHVESPGTALFPCQISGCYSNQQVELHWHCQPVMIPNQEPRVRSFGVIVCIVEEGKENVVGTVPHPCTVANVAEKIIQLAKQVI